MTTTAKIRVRLIGIDAPEMRPTPECYGPEATARLRELAGPGSRVWVAPDQDSWDRYRRRLFFVWTADGRLLNYDLVAEGYADAIRVRPNVTYWPLLRQAAADAKAAQRGLWAAAGPLRAWSYPRAWRTAVSCHGRRGGAPRAYGPPFPVTGGEVGPGGRAGPPSARGSKVAGTP